MGLRGAGKSTIARALGRDAGVAVIDLDDRTMALLGHATVADAFRRAGEPAFREAEVRALRAVIDECGERNDGLEARPTGRSCVVALGGGTPTAPGARELLGSWAQRGGAVIVYMHADPASLRARLREGDASRPSLTGAGVLEEIEAVYAARDPIYRACAHAVVDATAPADAVADSLKRVWRDQAARE